MFRFKKPYFLGIDFGTSYIKAVELTVKDGKPHLVNYGEVEMSFTEGKGAFQFSSPEERVTVYLKALLDKLRPQSDAAHVAMPGFSGLITLIELPEMKPDELEQAIRFEAHKYIPSPLEEVVLSWDVVSRKSDEAPNKDASRKMEVLLVAALHKEVEKYEHYLAGANLKMEVLELETFSLSRSLVDDNEGVYLIVDIGSRATNLILVENGVIKVNRNLNSGGNEITSTISESLNISWERAETLKKGNRDFFNSRESALVFPALEIITGEVVRILKAYSSKHPGKNLDRIILSGGTAKMKGLDTYLNKLLQIPVSVGDPWKSIAYEERLAPAISRFGTSYSAAIGLALGGVDAYQRS
jgi:type IV pilus assembly protein PilM